MTTKVAIPALYVLDVDISHFKHISFMEHSGTSSDLGHQIFTMCICFWAKDMM